MSKSLDVGQIESTVKGAGAEDIIVAKHVGEVFCDLDEAQAEALSKSNLDVSPVKVYRPLQWNEEEPKVDTLWDIFTMLRDYFTPPVTGRSLTVAILDTGMRSSHESLNVKDKVVYEANFTNAPSTEDVVGHGTQVGFIAAGGVHGDKMAGVAPGASLMNIKVINDDGEGTDETIVMGIDKVCEMAEDAMMRGFQPTDELFPNIINLSLGAEDDGNYNNPTRVACRRAVLDYGIEVIAAAGNDGPRMTTINMPATDPLVFAVGAIKTQDLMEIWDKSSRGPTEEGETKPDFVMWGTDIKAASHKNDAEYTTGSGTSFAAPMLAGVSGLLWETGRLVYGDWWRFLWSDAKHFTPYFCVLPEGEPLKKGNTYGHGLPAVGTMLGQLSEVPAIAMKREEMEMLMMMLMLTMMGSMGMTIR